MHAIRVGIVAPGHLITGLGPAASENPATGRGAAVILEQPEPGQLRASLDRCAAGIGEVCDGAAVDLFGQFFRGRFVGDLVRPRQFQQWVGKLAALGLITLAQAQEQFAHDADVGLRFARAIGALPVPLQPAAAVDQRAVLFGKTGGRQANDFSLDLVGFHIVVRSDVVPELRRFGGQRVHHHQPFEFGQRAHHAVFVRQRSDGIKALAEVAVDLALAHQVEHLQHVVVGDVEFRQMVVEPIVLRGGVGAVP